MVKFGLQLPPGSISPRVTNDCTSGLGSAATADIEIGGPSGVHQNLRGVKANQFLDYRGLVKP